MFISKLLATDIQPHIFTDATNAGTSLKLIMFFHGMKRRNSGNETD